MQWPKKRLTSLFVFELLIIWVDIISELLYLSLGMKSRQRQDVLKQHDWWHGCPPHHVVLKVAPPSPTVCSRPPNHRIAPWLPKSWLHSTFCRGTRYVSGAMDSIKAFAFGMHFRCSRLHATVQTLNDSQWLFISGCLGLFLVVDFLSVISSCVFLVVLCYVPCCAFLVVYFCVCFWGLCLFECTFLFNYV